MQVIVIIIRYANNSDMIKYDNSDMVKYDSNRDNDEDHHYGCFYQY